MEKIAVIGTGISGLSAAYLLNRSYDVTVYEKERRLGGHSRTVEVRHGDRTIAVDTGFIVFNEQNYPNLTALFRLLDVPVKKSDMSFALTVGNGWLEWGAKDLTAMLAQRRNLLRPKFLKLFADVMRFNKDALAEVQRAPDVNVAGLIQRMGLGDWFRRHYLLPMAGAIWSCPPCQMLEFPASSLVQFFANHNLLAMSGQPKWMTVEGGARTYVERLSASLEGRVQTACGAVRVERTARGARVTDARGETRVYDEVILACHSDEALALLADPSAEERAALGAIRYQPNRAVLHRDESFMPKRKACWASWVYHSDGAGDEPAISVTYWMNNLQEIDKRYPLFVTLNPAKPIAKEHTFDTHVFAHPVFDFAAMRAQKEIMKMQGTRNTWFCGAYLGYGFHEDGLKSGMNVAELLGAPAPWVFGEVRGDAQRIAPWREVNPAIADSILAGE
ncbi:MAG TPA: FAD-dependent oxidoreductase [Rhizomicrobium sp.]|nr:FAD-dependent oxidoreductase [Rhizomicrobium sp.]